MTIIECWFMDICEDCINIDRVIFSRKDNDISVLFWRFTKTARSGNIVHKEWRETVWFEENSHRWYLLAGRVKRPEEREGKIGRNKEDSIHW